MKATKSPAWPVVVRLLLAGPRSVDELAELTSVSRARVAHVLQQLQAAGLAETTGQRRTPGVSGSVCACWKWIAP